MLTLQSNQITKLSSDKMHYWEAITPGELRKEILFLEPTKE